MITLKDIKDHMIGYVSDKGVNQYYNFSFSEEDYYDEDGYAGEKLWNIIKDYWKNKFNTDEDFIYIVSGEWATEIDMDGGRDYIFESSKIIPLLFEYLYDVLKYSQVDYEKIIYNSVNLTDELSDMFLDKNVIRNDKLNNILK